jgi:hypothetical protein
MVALMLGGLVIGYGLIAYYSFVMDEAFTAIVRKILNKPPVPAVRGSDEWLLGGISAVAVLATIGTVFRKSWSPAVCRLAFGVSSCWSLVVASAPEALRRAWFSITVDRWAAAIVTVISFGGLVWSCSPRASNRSLRSELAA